MFIAVGIATDVVAEGIATDVAAEGRRLGVPRSSSAAGISADVAKRIATDVGSGTRRQRDNYGAIAPMGEDAPL